MKYTPTIGLEIHAELNTRTKMFCDCLNDPEEKRPNVNVCPICLGHPGTLPVANRAAVESILMVGMALSGDIPQHSKFDRKNYFYPDLPKGYQISQYDVPLVFGGVLRGVRLTRVHLEEDTGRLIHSVDGKNSLVDFNRAGVPLMELVTEPDIVDADQAIEFARELQLILRYLGISNADMERGQMRVEANVSLRLASAPEGKLGTKVEVKNINSFKAVHGAIRYELKRQEELSESDGTVIQETRGWDEKRQQTVSQRLKEEAHDYRYFPEPDLPPLDLSMFKFSEIKERILELPQAKRARFVKEYGLTPDQAEVLVVDRDAARFFEESISELKAEDGERVREETKLIINYLNSDVRGIFTDTGLSFATWKVTPENFADLIELIAHEKISSRAAKDLLCQMAERGGDPHEIMKEKGLEQISDEAALRAVALRVLSANPEAVADFKKGKENALQFLVGRAMGELKGAAHPRALRRALEEELRS